MTDRLRALIDKWRKEALRIRHRGGDTHASNFEQCASELEAALVRAGDPEAHTYASEKRCCSMCDAKKLCHVCGEPTLLACSDCCIDFGVSIYVCRQSACRDAHERKCRAKVRAGDPEPGEALPSAQEVLGILKPYAGSFPPPPTDQAFSRMAAWVIRLKAALVMLPGYLEAHANYLDTLGPNAGQDVRAARAELEHLEQSCPPASPTGPETQE